MKAAVHRLHLATYWAEDDQVEVYGYLVLLENHVILIDTGVGDDSSIVERLFRPRRRSISELLANHGVQTADVSTIINSHLHFDHCGNNNLFPNADIFVQSSEVAAARQPKYTIVDWFDYEGARLNEISGDAEILPGIRVIASPGHTPGHQSVLIEAPLRPTLIAAQAAYSAAEYETGGDISQAFEGMALAYTETIAHLKSLEASEVCFSHDHRAVHSS